MSPVRYVAEKLNPMHAVGRKRMKEPYIVEIARLKGRVAAVVIIAETTKGRTLNVLGLLLFPIHL